MVVKGDGRWAMGNGQWATGVSSWTGVDDVLVRGLPSAGQGVKRRIETRRVDDGGSSRIARDASIKERQSQTQLWEPLDSYDLRRLPPLSVSYNLLARASGNLERWGSRGEGLPRSQVSLPFLDGALIHAGLSVVERWPLH